MGTKKSSPKSPQERAEIANAVTVEERLKAVRERLDPSSSIPRKTLTVGLSLNKGNGAYKMIEEISVFKGYPVGGEIDEETGRVTFKYTKEEGYMQWRISEEVLETIAETLRVIVTTVLTTENLDLLSKIRDEAGKNQEVSETGLEGVKRLFRWIKDYRKATEDLRTEAKLKAAEALLASLNDEAKQALLQRAGSTPSRIQHCAE